MSRVINIHKVNGKRPDYDIYIGRAVKGTEFFEDSFWANPFNPKMYISIYDCLYDYEVYMRKKLKYCPEKILEIEGKILGCWCDPSPCHGHVLLKLLSEYKRGLFL